MKTAFILTFFFISMHCSVLDPPADVNVLLAEKLVQDPQPPANLAESLALKKFVKLVEENQLNVTIILSTIDRHSNGKIREAVSLSLGLPPNNVQLQQSNINKDEVKAFVKQAAQENLPASGVTSSESSLKIYKNYKDLPITLAHKLIGRVRNGKTGLNFNSQGSFAAQQTFITPTDSGNETTKVLYGNADVNVLESQNLNEKELETVKRALGTATFIYEEADVNNAVVAILDSELPGNNWQAASDVGDNSYVDSSKYAKLELFETNFLIFSI